MKWKINYGEPDVVIIIKQTNFFYDLLKVHRDEEAIVMTNIRVKKKIQTRKQCLDVAAWVFPTEVEYKELQQLGNFDTKRQVG
jgi:hypothetical protein